MRVPAIQTGTVAIHEAQVRGRGRGLFRIARAFFDRTWTEPLPIYAYAIEHPEGVIVVDTGETAHSSDSGYFPWWHPYFRFAVRCYVQPDEEVGPRLRAAGLAPEDVRSVVLTHLHTDHAGGLHHFPSAEILVSRTEYGVASGLLGRLRGFLPNRWPDWFQPRRFDFDAEPFGPFPRSLAVTSAGDVRIVPTPGHTPGHVSVVAQDDDRSLFFGGDSSYSEALMLEGAIDGIAPDGRRARRSLQRIAEFARERPTVFLPAHEPGAAQRLADRRTVPIP